MMCLLAVTLVNSFKTHVRTAACVLLPLRSKTLTHTHSLSPAAPQVDQLIHFGAKVGVGVWRWRCAGGEVGRWRRGGRCLLPFPPSNTHLHLPFP